jgi:hypothetical protein
MGRLDMRTSILGAALLLAGTGAATLAAGVVDSNGNGLALNGSDSLFDVTNSVLSVCSTAITASGGMGPYLGGGSDVGAGRMDSSTQAVSPMSAALTSAQYCITPVSIYGGPPGNTTVTSSETSTEALLLGVDGVAIVADQNNSCSQVSDGVGGTTPQNGFGLGGGTSMTVNLTNGGTSQYMFGDPAAALYPNQPSFDALAVLYFGLTHDGQYNCSSDTRRSLIADWRNLFTNPCTAGMAACTTGLTHAWRRSDLSGITDAFVKVLNPPDGNGTNGKGNTTASPAIGVGIGSPPTFTGAGARLKSNPFCNSQDAYSGTTTAGVTAGTTTSVGGSSDYQDLDRVRTTCSAVGSPNESVCQGWKNLATSGGSNQGDLGVVLVVQIPDATVTQATDAFPTQVCSPACTLVNVMKPSFIPVNYRCPNGSAPVLGGCWMPALQGSTPDPRCISNAAMKCVGSVGKPDGRVYNMVTVVSRSQILAVQTSNPAVFAHIGNKPYQFAEDQFGRLIDKSYYRVHASQNLNPDLTVPGTTGFCTQNNDTAQIGCLTNADPCSVGYAGRQAAEGYPGGTPQRPKALNVNGIPPFTPNGVQTCTAAADLGPGVNCATSPGATVVASNADPDFALKALLFPKGSTPLYPFDYRLYFTTIYGFQKTQGAENALAGCYAASDISGPALTSFGFVPNPFGVQCIDYPEHLPTSTTPAPNTQGLGNAALGGCALGTVRVDACTTTGMVGGPSNFNDIEGHPVPEASETY